MGNLCSCCKGESEKFKSAVKILKRERYIYERKLGMGAFGDVIEVRSLDKKRLKFAAKIVSSEKCSQVELELWRSFEHDNVVPLLEIIQESDINIFLMPLHKLTMMEAIEKGSFINSAESFNEVKNWLTGVLLGMEFLHGINVCHADLKVNNILITNRRTAVICDFSFSCLKNGNITKYGLPPFFRPPEAFFHDGSLDPVNGESFDNWSFGILALYAWTRIYSDEWTWTLEHWKKLAYPVLFDCMQLPKFTKLVKEFFPKAVITPEEICQALNLLQGVLQYEAKERPPASIILHHPLLNKEARVEKLFPVSSIWTYRHSELPSDLEYASNDINEWFASKENEPSIQDFTNFGTLTSDFPENRTNKLDENTFTLNPENTHVKTPVIMEDFEGHSKESPNSKDINDYELSNAEVTNKNLSSKRYVTHISDVCHSHLHYLGYSLLHELCMML